MHIQISTPENVYSIVPVGNQIYSLREFDIHEVGDVGCATSSDEKETDGTPGPIFNAPENVPSRSNARWEPCDEQINPRVLVLYSTGALAHAGGTTEINNVIAASVAQFNLAISNSNINENAKLILAGTQLLISSVDTDGMRPTLNNLKSNSTVQSLRDSYQADLVVYLNKLGSIYANGIAGHSETIHIDSAYAVVQIGAAIENRTFAHEVGHLFGCRHDGHSGTPSYARGYNIKNALGITVDRTIMATGGNSENRLIHFSNPDVSVSGRATGDTDHDNARRIDETWSTISSFRSNPPNPGSAHIEGTTYVTSPGNYTYEVVHKCFLGPYSFQWQFSTDGINYTNASTTDTYTHYIGHAQTLYLKCQIGIYTTVYATVVAEMDEEPEVVTPPVSMLAEMPVYSESQAVIYPNPSGGLVNISYITSEKARATLKISDSSGKQVKTLFNNRLHAKPGYYSATWEASNQEPGIYIYRLEIKGKTKTGQIILTNEL